MRSIVVQMSQEIKSISINNSRYKISKRFCMVMLRKLGYCLIFIAIIFQCTRQCVAKWYKRFNKYSFAGLDDLKRSGRPRKLSVNLGYEFENSISCILEKDKNILCQSAQYLFNRIFSSLSPQVSKSTIHRFFNYHKFNKLIPRPVHIKNNKELMSKWVEEITPVINNVKETNNTKKVEIYFQDESRYGQQTCKYKIWAKKGSRPTYTKQNGFLNSWIFGAINPKSGKKFGLILPKLDTKNMQIFLNKFSKTIHYKKHALLILDGSSAHRNGILKIPKNISLHFLPPYSPELNPIERLWLFIKKNYLSFKLYDSMEKIIDIGADAWKKVDEKIVQSLCHCSYLSEAC